jgi:hypothetical protein
MFSHSMQGSVPSHALGAAPNADASGIAAARNGRPSRAVRRRVRGQPTDDVRHALENAEAEIARAG